MQIDGAERGGERRVEGRSAAAARASRRSTRTLCFFLKKRFSLGRSLFFSLCRCVCVCVVGVGCAVDRHVRQQQQRRRVSGVAGARHRQQRTQRYARRSHSRRHSRRLRRSGWHRFGVLRSCRRRVVASRNAALSTPAHLFKTAMNKMFFFFEKIFRKFRFQSFFLWKENLENCLFRRSRYRVGAFVEIRVKILQPPLRAAMFDLRERRTNEARTMYLIDRPTRFHVDHRVELERDSECYDDQIR